MMITHAMLTTEDNPHDPFEDYPAWHQWDLRAGYNSESFLARLVFSSDELSEADQALDIERAIDEIVRENVNGVYKKVTKDLPEG